MFQFGLSQIASVTGQHKLYMLCVVQRFHFPTCLMYGACKEEIKRENMCQTYALQVHDILTLRWFTHLTTPGTTCRTTKTNRKYKELTIHTMRSAGKNCYLQMPPQYRLCIFCDLNSKTRGNIIEGYNHFDIMSTNDKFCTLMKQTATYLYST